MYGSARGRRGAYCADWLNGGLRLACPSLSLLGPPAIRSSSAPAVMHSSAIARPWAMYSGPLLSLAPSVIPETSASRSP
jgi:hypothetical protein